MQPIGQVSQTELYEKYASGQLGTHELLYSDPVWQIVQFVGVPVQPKHGSMHPIHTP
jgi:hypothetical protein